MTRTFFVYKVLSVIYTQKCDVNLAENMTEIRLALISVRR